MSVLDIHKCFDPFFDQKWQIWLQSWRLYGEHATKEITKHWFEHMLNDAEVWDIMLDQVTVAHWIYYKDIPEWVYDMRDRLNAMIVEMVQHYNPELRYTTIEYNTTLQGGDLIMPSIEVHADKEWFGYDKNLDNPWHERHAGINAHISHIATNYRGYQGSRKDPWPTPTKTAIIPESKDWKPNNDWNSRLNSHNRMYVIFPEGEKYYRNR